MKEDMKSKDVIIVSPNDEELVKGGGENVHE